MRKTKNASDWYVVRCHDGWLAIRDEPNEAMGPYTTEDEAYEASRAPRPDPTSEPEKDA